MGVSVMMGLGSGDLSMGFSSSLSWWIQRSGGLTSLEFPLYLWDPFTDLQAARFLGKENKCHGLRCSFLSLVEEGKFALILGSFSSCGQLSKSRPLGRTFEFSIRQSRAQLWCYDHMLCNFHSKKLTLQSLQLLREYSKHNGKVPH